MKMRALGVATLLCSGLFAAQASADTITASQILSGSYGDFTFTAAGGDGYLATKTRFGVTGVGVAGGYSGNEIDIGESVTAASSSAFRLAGVGLAFLFDGPEYGDVQEVADITATFADGSTHLAQLTNYYSGPTDTSLTLMVDGVDMSSLIYGASVATNASPGTVNLGALFGSNLLSSVAFTAEKGVCYPSFTCTSQSDYSITRISVPEPGTLALLGLGLIAGAFSMRRRVS